MKIEEARELIRKYELTLEGSVLHISRKTGRLPMGPPSAGAHSSENGGFIAIPGEEAFLEALGIAVVNFRSPPKPLPRLTTSTTVSAREGSVVVYHESGEVVIERSEFAHLRMAMGIATGKHDKLVPVMVFVSPEIAAQISEPTIVSMSAEGSSE